MTSCASRFPNSVCEWGGTLRNWLGFVSAPGIRPSHGIVGCGGEGRGDLFAPDPVTPSMPGPDLADPARDGPAEGQQAEECRIALARLVGGGTSLVMELEADNVRIPGATAETACSRINVSFDCDEGMARGLWASAPSPSVPEASAEVSWREGPYPVSDWICSYGANSEAFDPCTPYQLLVDPNPTAGFAEPIADRLSLRYRLPFTAASSPTEIRFDFTGIENQRPEDTEGSGHLLVDLFQSPACRLEYDPRARRASNEFIVPPTPAVSVPFTLILPLTRGEGIGPEEAVVVSALLCGGEGSPCVSSFEGFGVDRLRVNIRIPPVSSPMSSEEGSNR